MLAHRLSARLRCTIQSTVSRSIRLAIVRSLLNRQVKSTSSSGADTKYDPPEEARANAHVRGNDAYTHLHRKSIEDPTTFWGSQADLFLQFERKYDVVSRGSFADGNVEWFPGGVLNASVNCIDKHVSTKGDQTAILWEGDDPGDCRRITYKQLLHEVCRWGNMLSDAGVKRGDRVCIYMPMVPETAFAMLACARIGAVHSVVFAGFSAAAIRQRILDADCRVVLTSDGAKRGGKAIPLKATVDEALKDCPGVERVFVYQRTGAPVHMIRDRDLWVHDELPKYKPVCPPAGMDSEDPLFLLYTSGSTGKPKGLQHSTAGYLLYAAITHKYVFDNRPGDVHACMADVGWITGHSYILYGPLCNGATTVMFESLPTYPDAGRYWDMVQRHRITALYTSPTAIRAIMKDGSDPVKKYDRSSLRVLGSVGEPINPAAWEWYYHVVGDAKCAIADTYFQTETGSIIFTPLPGATPMKAGSCAVPFFGVDYAVVDVSTGKPLAVERGKETVGQLALTRPFPGMARTIWRDHGRYMKTYFKDGLYLTGDGTRVDEDGYVWITGRADDVIKVSGHRLGTAEIEDALTQHPEVAEAAVIGVPHDLKGESVFAYAMMKRKPKPHEHLELVKSLKGHVRKGVGGLAVPDHIVLTEFMPRTRSGKIMRRVLRNVARGKTDRDSLGDLSTLADPKAIEGLLIDVAAQKPGSDKHATPTSSHTPSGGGEANRSPETKTG